MPSLSITLITKNEAHNVRRCLESVKWANEIIVLDSGSTDDTVAICREYTDKIFITDWPGFGPQKNRALEKATGEWILSIDADEEIPPALRDEIQATIADPKYAAYTIKRLSTYCGKVIRYSGWQSDKPLRLFKKTVGRFSDDIVHEKVVVKSEVGSLKQVMWHFSFANLTQVLDKVNFYSTYGANMRFQKGRKSNLGIALVRGGWAFFRSYFIKLGFLDGRAGFLLATSNALGTFFCYAKLIYLWEAKQKNNV